MRKRTGLLILLVLMAGAWRPAALSAQGAHAAEIRQLREQLDSLKPRLYQIDVRDSAERRVRLERERLEDMVALDTAVIGPFRIVGTPVVVRRTRPSFERAWERMAPLFLNMEETLSGRVFLVIQGNRSSSNLNQMQKLPGHQVTLFPRMPNPVEWQTASEGALGFVLMPHLPPPLRKWMGNGILGMTTEANSLYRYLVMPNRMIRDDSGVRCADGVVEACHTVLGLEDTGSVRGSHPLRTSFLSFVIERAPAGSLAALQQDSAPVAVELEKLGGAPLDTLLREWVETLHSERSREAGTAGHRVLSTLIWAGIFGALSMRSTRRRLG